MRFVILSVVMTALFCICLSATPMQFNSFNSDQAGYAPSKDSAKDAVDPYDHPEPLTDDLQAVSLAGEQIIVQCMLYTYYVTICNAGSVTQTNYSVKLMHGGTELATASGLTIQPQQVLQIPVNWVPLISGETDIYGKVVLAGDSNPLNDETDSLAINILPMGSFAYTIGAGNEEAYVPWNLMWHYSLFENLFYPTEINFIGCITSIAFYSDFASEIPDANLTLWLGSTTQENLESGWIPSTQLTQVFSGQIDIPAGPGPVIIELQVPFMYLGDNLVLMAKHGFDLLYFTDQLRFDCQTIGTNRARLCYDDFINIDPASPPNPGTLSGTFPRTTFMFVQNPMASLVGIVYSNNAPLQNATVSVANTTYQTTSSTNGHYQFNYIPAGTYQVTASRTGFAPQTLTVTILEDQVTFLDFNLLPLPVVTVFGQVGGSGAPEVGLANATVTLDGGVDYTTVTNAQGAFSFPGVFANSTFQYTVTHNGYLSATGTLTTGTADLNMGIIALTERLFPPWNVSASVNPQHTAVNLIWNSPLADSSEVDESFEGTTFPPAGWTQVITCFEPANPNGVYPTWCRTGTVNYAGFTITPTEGEWQAGLTFGFAHQDEWLKTLQFICPPEAVLVFDTNAYYGSTNSDHYYVEVSDDNGSTWTHLWDASAQPAGWNHYQIPVSIALNEYAEQQIIIAWHADDPNATSDGIWYPWFIDNVRLINSFNPNPCAERSLLGYKVWRLHVGQETDEALWTLLTSAYITATAYADGGWAQVEHDGCKWAVKAIYTGGYASEAAFSNSISEPGMPGILTGVVRNLYTLQPIVGATVTLETFSVITDSNGSYALEAWEGMYSVSVTAPGYADTTYSDVSIMWDQTTTLNPWLRPVSGNGDENLLPTALLGCYPNPFSDNLWIEYRLEKAGDVKLSIFNTKGQLVKTIVNHSGKAGSAQMLWDGTDNNGNQVAGGVYHIRLQAGKYVSNRKILLLR